MSDITALEASAISNEDYAAIVKGIASLSRRAGLTNQIPENAEHLARAARDLATVAQSFKPESLSNVYRVKA